MIKNNHEIHNTNMLKQMQNIEKEKQKYIVENSKILINVENIGETLKEKQNEIDKLNETVLSLETDIKSICGDFLFSCRNLKKVFHVQLFIYVKYNNENIFLTF